MIFLIVTIPTLALFAYIICEYEEKTDRLLKITKELIAENKSKTELIAVMRRDMETRDAFDQKLRDRRL